MSDVKTTTAAIYQAVLDSLNSKGECGVLPPAPPGKSAYEVAVANGFKGSERQWLDSLTFKQEQEIARVDGEITKINQKFSNPSYAASRLVGLQRGNVSLVENTFRAAMSLSNMTHTLASDSLYDYNTGIPGDIVYSSGWAKNSPFSTHHTGYSLLGHHDGGDPVQFGVTYLGSARLAFRGSKETQWVEVYTNKNTTRDTATGFLKVSSPVLHVYNNSITKIHEAEQLDITVDKKGVGHYEIHGTTGLRKNDGWFMSPPRDMHSNVLCMVDYEEKDGVIILKTYKKKFDFETVSIVHDYENPMDIPEGACVEFRFNDLPQEQLEVPNPEVEDK